MSKPSRSSGLIDWFWRHGASVAAIAVPGLALWLPSGYSWGPAWLLLCALLTLHRWWPMTLTMTRRAPRPALPDPRRTMLAALAVLIVLMALLWWIDTGPRPGFNNFGAPIKYLLALPCLAFVLAAPPRPGALWLGVSLGGIGGGVTALVQRYALHTDRAGGYTNVIQFGDISLLLGLVALTVLVLRWRHLSVAQRVALAAGGVLGLTGSILSQSRGGWLALPLVWLAWAVGLWRIHGWQECWRRLGRLTVLLALAAGALAALQLREVGNRMEQARSEVAAYERHGDADTSVGQRLAHWQVALLMGRERPALGWGHSYDAEKERLVAAGLGNPAILAFGHAHNEWLDMFARRGLVGVALLAAWFALPALMFFPRRRRRDDVDDEGGAAFAIRMTGLLLPVCYVGFGLTQVLFAHNSGHMVYLYALVIWIGALRGAESRESGAITLPLAAPPARTADAA